MAREIDAGFELTPIQIEVLSKSTAKINIAHGSTRSSKSICYLFGFFFSVKTIDKLQNEIYVISGHSLETIRNNCVGPLEMMFPSQVKYFPGKRMLSIGNKDVVLIGAHDERAYAKIKGSTIAVGYIDEATEIPVSYLDMFLSRLSRPYSTCYMTTNPAGPTHYIKQKIDMSDGKQISSHQLLLNDNPHLSQDYKDFLANQFTGVFYKRYILGEWVQAEGAIFDMFDDNLHVVEEAPYEPTFYFAGIDYGTTNPFAMVIIGYNASYKPHLWVEKEYYYDSRKHGRQKTDAEYAEEIAYFCDPYPIRSIYIDPSAASFKAELRKCVQIPVIDAKNDVIDRIRVISRHLADGNLVICKDCTNLISEIHSYVWDPKASERGEDKPLKKFDHAVDAMTYGIYSQFGTRATSIKKRESLMDARLNPQNYLGWGHQFRGV